VNTFRPGSAKDESAVEMLILTPDNKLILRNSREDTGSADRAARHELWLNEIRQLRDAQNAANAANMPGRKQ
jgi:hypothetical protein